MFMQPLTLGPLLGLVAALAWVAVRPATLPAMLAAVFVALLVWSLRRHALAQESAFARRLAGAEEQVRAQRSATEQSELARARVETELRATDERYQLALRGCQDGLWEWDLGSDRVFLSPRWKGMLGFETPEISDDKAGWLARVHADDRVALEESLSRHIAGPDATFDHEMRLLHKDGSIRNVLSRGVAIRRENGTPYRLVGLDTDVTRLKRVQTVLDAVAEGTSGAFGQQFFQAMVRHFARALEVDRAFITECADDPATRVRTLAVWVANGPAENFEYVLEGTPCAEVIGEGRMCFHREGLSERFPREVGWQAFLGLPIIASDGRMLGHLAFFDSRPLGDDVLVDSIYRIFLARAAAEMERIQALARLAQGESSKAAS
ncbi:MAG: PAS domain-containing protein [Burkholderiales bacterium]|nr:PAS domain-containing protein [Burkholderiales bacterium]